MVIGSEGVSVEIDKSKFGKCKYNQGHKVEVFGFLVVLSKYWSRRYLLSVLRVAQLKLFMQ